LNDEIRIIQRVKFLSTFLTVNLFRIGAGIQSRRLMPLVVNVGMGRAITGLLRLLLVVRPKYHDGIGIIQRVKFLATRLAVNLFRIGAAILSRRLMPLAFNVGMDRTCAGLLLFLVARPKYHDLSAISKLNDAIGIIQRVRFLVTLLAVNRFRIGAAILSRRLMPLAYSVGMDRTCVGLLLFLGARPKYHDLSAICKLNDGIGIIQRVRFLATLLPVNRFRIGATILSRRSMPLTVNLGIDRTYVGLVRLRLPWNDCNDACQPPAMLVYLKVILGPMYHTFLTEEITLPAVVCEEHIQVKSRLPLVLSLYVA
jgi:hypothetical protein